jgi:hypothetical protein
MQSELRGERHETSQATSRMTDDHPRADDEEPPRTQFLSPDGRPWSRVWYGEPIENPDWDGHERSSDK